jgi:hypothetical protein
LLVHHSAVAHFFDWGRNVLFELLETGLLVILKEFNILVQLVNVFQIVVEALKQIGSFHVLWIFFDGGFFILEVLCHQTLFLVEISFKLLKEVSNFSELLVSAAQLFKSIPLDDFIFKFVDFNIGFVNFLLERLHGFNVFRCSDLFNEIVNVVQLGKVVLNVFENFWHFILEGIDELFFLIVRAVAIHVFADLIDFLQLVFGFDQTFSEEDGLFLEQVSGIGHVLKYKFGVEVFEESFDFFKFLFRFLDCVSEVSDV